MRLVPKQEHADLATRKYKSSKKYFKKVYLQWGKDPLQTALFKMVTINIWQFLKSDSIFSIDSILGKKVNFNLSKYVKC